MQQKYEIQNLQKKVSRIKVSEASDTLMKNLEISAAREKVLKKWRSLKAKGLKDQEICEILEVSRASLYRWQKDSIPKTKAPKHKRKPQWSLAQEDEVYRLRLGNPLFGKEKIHALMINKTSVSTVGRILQKLVKLKKVSPVHMLTGYKKPKKRRFFDNSWAQRLPKGMQSNKQGVLVQIDHMTCRVGDKTIKHFNAWDRKTKINVADVYSRATSGCAAKFLDEVIKEYPFKIESVQVDGGSEFMKEFEQACQEKNIKLFVLPPRSPKLNGGVERINQTWKIEFYNFRDDLPENILQLSDFVKDYQHFYNFDRPHKALDFLTPFGYFFTISSNPFESHML